MKNNKFIFENNINSKYLSKKLSNKFYKKYFQIEKEVKAQIDNPENVYNILSQKFRLSFNVFFWKTPFLLGFTIASSIARSLSAGELILILTVIKLL